LAKRKILGSESKSKFRSLSASPVTKSSSTLTSSKVKILLRKKRSSAYMEALQKLDSGEHVSDADSINQLIETIKSELPGLSSFLIGIVAKCHLGHPYEVHTLEILGDIIHHYKIGEPLPSALEKARSMAQHPAYSYIEVYSDYIVAVSKNGSTSIVETEGDTTSG